MEEKKAKKLKWTNPTIENLSRSKMTHGATCNVGSVGDCVDGGTPGGGFNACQTGGIANGCSSGNFNIPI